MVDTDDQERVLDLFHLQQKIQGLCCVFTKDMRRLFLEIGITWRSEDHIEEIVTCNGSPSLFFQYCFSPFRWSRNQFILIERISLRFGGGIRRPFFFKLLQYQKFYNVSRNPTVTYLSWLTAVLLLTPLTPLPPAKSKTCNAVISTGVRGVFLHLFLSRWSLTESFLLKDRLQWGQQCLIVPLSQCSRLLCTSRSLEDVAL